MDLVNGVRDDFAVPHQSKKTMTVFREGDSLHVRSGKTHYVNKYINKDNDRQMLMKISLKPDSKFPGQFCRHLREVCKNEKPPDSKARREFKPNQEVFNDIANYCSTVQNMYKINSKYK